MHPRRRLEPIRPSTRRALALRGLGGVLVAASAFVVGCSSSQTSGASIPAAGRSMWNQCSSPMTAWCHRQGQGDPTLDRECEATTAREYAALPEDAARRQYLTAHGCTL